MRSVKATLIWLNDRTDIYKVGKVVFFATGGLATLTFAFMIAYVYEPRSDVNYQTLDVVSARWYRQTTNGKQSPSKFLAVVILPNAQQTKLSSDESHIADDMTACARVSIGNWLRLYHVEIVAPSLCDADAPFE